MSDERKLGRREFLRQGWARTVSAAAPKRPGARFVRPPHALEEPAFLDACTRCGDCVGACPHGVVFALGATAGTGLGGTPALDLMNRGCHMCDDWPCVAACEPGALVLPEPQSRDGEGAPTAPIEALAPPVLAAARIETGRCLAWQGPECGACRDVCPVKGAIEWIDLVKPRIDASRCVGCALCREACIVAPKAVSLAPSRAD